MFPILAKNAVFVVIFFFFFSNTEEFLIVENSDKGRFGNSSLHDLMCTPSPPTLTSKKSARERYSNYSEFV